LKLIVLFSMLLMSCGGEVSAFAGVSEAGEEVTDVSVENFCGSMDGCVDSYPFVRQDSTASATQRVLEKYSCAPSTNEGGPERVIPVSIPESGLFIASVEGGAPGVDVDVHLLSAPDAKDCLIRGDKDVAMWVQPGLYYVAVDTYVDSAGKERAGEYTLNLDFHSPKRWAVHGISAPVAQRALHAFSVAWSRKETSSLDYTVIDFHRASSEPRMWVFDLRSTTPVQALLVAHGSGSNPGPDPSRATAFSNISESHQSSLGMMRTGESYYGSFGFSMKLDGLEEKFNGRVRDRHVVVHGADWASPEFLARAGTLGQSWGCPTVDDKAIKPLIKRLRGGSLMFSDYPDPEWLAESEYLPMESECTQAVACSMR